MTTTNQQGMIAKTQSNKVAKNSHKQLKITFL